MRFVFTTAVCLIGLLAFSRSSSRPEMYAVTLPFKSVKDIQDLAARGFDIAGVDHENHQFQVLTDEVGVQQLRSRLQVRHIEADLIVPTVDAGYRKLEEVVQALEDIEKAYPSLAAVSVIGQSREGRDIPAIRLTDSFFLPTQDKPVLLIDAMHHAREVMTPEIAIDIAEQLTSRFAKDPKAKEWLRNNEIWIVPMVNPDGNHKVWNSSSMWRKNTRGGYGVDNNRNYPFAWNSCRGSSGSTSDEQYRGPSAGSEPETQALMDLAKQIKPVMNISYHSFSEIVIYPYGCRSQKLSTSQKSIIVGMAKDLAAKHARDSGSGTYVAGASYDLLYEVDGGSIDWMFGMLGTLSFVVEVNSQDQGFQPSYTRWRDSTVKRARAGWEYILERMMGPAVRVQATSGTDVEVLTETGTSIFKKPADDKGWAHFFVNPGKYQVKKDKSSTPQLVTVGTSTEVVL